MNWCIYLESAVVFWLFFDNFFPKNAWLKKQINPLSFFPLMGGPNTFLYSWLDSLDVLVFLVDSMYGFSVCSSIWICFKTRFVLIFICFISNLACNLKGPHLLWYSSSLQRKKPENIQYCLNGMPIMGEAWRVSAACRVGHSFLM